MKHARFVKIGLVVLALAVTLPAAAQNGKKFDGLGLGLGGAKRLVNEFEIASTPGEGTRIVAVRWA